MGVWQDGIKAMRDWLRRNNILHIDGGDGTFIAEFKTGGRCRIQVRSRSSNWEGSSTGKWNDLTKIDLCIPVERMERMRPDICVLCVPSAQFEEDDGYPLFGWLSNDELKRNEPKEYPNRVGKNFWREQGELNHMYELKGLLKTTLVDVPIEKEQETMEQDTNKGKRPHLTYAEQRWIEQKLNEIMERTEDGFYNYPSGWTDVRVADELSRQFGRTINSSAVSKFRNDVLNMRRAHKPKAETVEAAISPDVDDLRERVKNLELSIAQLNGTIQQMMRLMRSHEERLTLLEMKIGQIKLAKEMV